VLPKQLQWLLNYDHIEWFNEIQGADIQSKVEELEELHQALRNRDKMKDDAIAQLLDKVIGFTARMQELERKQQQYQ
jgi:Skp family chaperone for outer membrane proteins